jgi:outer membrane receptor protein involved in Fe transport
LFEIDDWRTFQTNFTYNYDGTHFPSVIPGVPFDAPSYSYLIEGTYRAELTEDLNFMLGGLVDFHRGHAAFVGVDDAIPTFTEIWYGVYTQMEYQANDWLKLVGGMQGNMPGEIKGGIVPRAAVIASLHENWTAKFLYGQAFRSPYQAERSINVPGILTGNPDLIPEKVQTFDFQLAYHTEEFRLAATWFHSDYWDIITRSSTLPQTYSNSGSMTFDGFELENEWEITKRLRWLGSLTYQDNVRGNIHNTTGVPNWMAKMGIAYYDPCSGWSIGIFDTYFGDPIVPESAVIVNEQPRAHHLVSLNMTLDLDRRLQWCTGRKMQLQFLIQNLLDEDIQHIEFERELINSLPAGPGRQFYGGFTMAY